MKSSWIGTTLVVGFATFAAAGSAVAEPPGGIRVLDISIVFEKHEGFKARREEFKKDLQDFDARMRTERKALVAEAEAQKDFAQGSPEHKQSAEKIANMQADMQVRRQLKGTEFRDREAQIYYEAYRDIQEQVTQYCHQRGIVAVLRFDSRNIDPAQRESVVEGLNRFVVYQAQLDITGDIINRVNRGVPPKEISRGPQIPRTPKR